MHICMTCAILKARLHPQQQEEMQEGNLSSLENVSVETLSISGNQLGKSTWAP